MHVSDLVHFEAFEANSTPFYTENTTLNIFFAEWFLWVMFRTLHVNLNVANRGMSCVRYCLTEIEGVG